MLLGDDDGGGLVSLLTGKKWSKIRKQSLFETEKRAPPPFPPAFFPTLTSQCVFFLLAAVSGIGDNCQ